MISKSDLLFSGQLLFSKCLKAKSLPTVFYSVVKLYQNFISPFLIPSARRDCSLNQLGGSKRVAVAPKNFFRKVGKI